MKKEDVELVKQNGNHILNSVEKGLLNIIQITDIVPTNTQEKWYESLSNIENEYCNLFFYQSSDEKWIKIDINYHCSNISKENTIFNNKLYKVLNIVSPNILSEFPNYKDKLIFISESVSSTMKENDLEVLKDISFVFSRSVLKKYNKEILSDFQKVLNIIRKETNLIKEDHLARGDLIVSSQINVYKKDNGNWNIRDENLKYNTDESTLTEYWGEFNIYSNDFISTTYNYPWMPVSTSDFVLPF
ncbi:hypothetical protein HSACCH_00028 [Halanaerobium saccharolyticum subsp. saccharolyticum DSM 6643]|uniref:Uncharacterized protein n=2 Tax=Halanaerobium saccharolyticum TaxID=43595 RepID=M5DXH2_9FIRM|nr:hypothetical protein HSACCH_00028 [Halanaerobium saccharolyticum subsp. saccharolyticum DSM 6643]